MSHQWRNPAGWVPEDKVSPNLYWGGGVNTEPAEARVGILLQLSPSLGVPLYSQIACSGFFISFIEKAFIKCQLYVQDGARTAGNDVQVSLGDCPPSAWFQPLLSLPSPLP